MINIDDIYEIKLSDYSVSTCTSVETEPLDLEKLKEAIIRIRNDRLELESKILWAEMRRIHLSEAFANPFTL